MKYYLQKHDKTLYSDNWSTPKDIYEFYKSIGYLDPCPLFADDLIPTMFYEKFYSRNLFINPPYSQIEDWITFAINHYKNGYNTIVLLVPSRTDTKWFHKLLKYNPYIVFIKGRLKFGDSNNTAPFPSVLIILANDLYYNPCLLNKEN